LRVKAKLIDIKSVDNLNLLFFDYKNEIIKVLMLEMNIDLKLNQYAYLKIKPTLLFLNSQKFDFENRLKVEIVNIKKGEIMANVLCRFKEDYFEVLMLKEGINFEKEAYLYFKSNFVAVEV